MTYPDERARPILERTLGVVLFQEQILRLAMELGGFTAAEADELRRAIGFTRSQERLNIQKERLKVALRRNGVSEPATEYLISSLASFALYGFPESHAISFALIAYASAWLKVRHPAVFYAAILNNLPMGFYSAASLVQDGKRHGVRFLPPCIQASDTLSRVDEHNLVRLGLGTVQGVRAKAVDAAVAERRRVPFASLGDFLRRTSFTAKERRTLATAGALAALAPHRRAALWLVEADHPEDELFRRQAEDSEPRLSPLEKMTHLERLRADYETLGLTVGQHPMRIARANLEGIWTAADLKSGRHGQRVRVAGAVTCRQRPGTAKGFVFITLEDETGTSNTIVRPRLFERERLVINLEPALLITGTLQNEEGVIHVMAEEIVAMPSLGLPEQISHDFH